MDNTSVRSAAQVLEGLPLQVGHACQGPCPGKMSPPGKPCHPLGKANSPNCPFGSCRNGAHSFGTQWRSRRLLVPLSQVLTKRWSCSVVTPRTLTGRGARFPGPRPGLNRSPQRPAPPAFGRGQRPPCCVLPVRAPIRLPEETAERNGKRRRSNIKPRRFETTVGEAGAAEEGPVLGGSAPPVCCRGGRSFSFAIDLTPHPQSGTCSQLARPFPWKRMIYILSCSLTVPR